MRFEAGHLVRDLERSFVASRDQQGVGVVEQHLRLGRAHQLDDLDRLADRIRGLVVALLCLVEPGQIEPSGDPGPNALHLGAPEQHLLRLLEATEASQARRDRLAENPRIRRQLEGILHDLETALVVALRVEELHRLGHHLGVRGEVSQTLLPALTRQLVLPPFPGED